MNFRINCSKRKIGWTAHDHQFLKKAKDVTGGKAVIQDCVDSEPRLIRVDPGHQHIGRVAGHVGLDALRRTRSQNTIRSLLKSAVDLIKADKNMVLQVQKAQKSKVGLGLGPRGVSGSLKRKPQAAMDTPSKKHQSALVHKVLAPVGVSKNPPSPCMKKILQKGRVASQHLQNHGKMDSNGNNIPHTNGAPPPRQEKKVNGFSTDGASVADWIVNCTFRSVTLEEQEAAKEESRSYL